MKRLEVGQLVTVVAPEGEVTSTLRVIALHKDHVYTCPYDHCRMDEHGFAACYKEHKAWKRKELA